MIDMSTEENKAIVRRFIEEVFNPGNLDAIDTFVSPDMIDFTCLPDNNRARRASDML